MRMLGYFDAYLGLLGAQANYPAPHGRLIDVGAGTGAFAEAWVAMHGPGSGIDLLDPSARMLEHAAQALARHGVTPRLYPGMLGTPIPPAQTVLAAHVLEHCPDPALALRQIRDLLAPGGRLFLVVSKPHWCNAIIWLQWRHRTFQRGQITALLDAAGLRLTGEHAFPVGPPSRTSRGYIAMRP